MKEYESYRAILADLLQAQDSKHWTQKQTSYYLGIDPRTVKRRYGIDRKGINVWELARRISHG